MMSNEAMKDGTSFESPQWSSSSEADHSKIETEEQLFDLAKEIANRMHESRIKGFFDLGSCLLAFYPSQYGDETIQRLSEKIGFSTDNIYKARQFAENFSTEQVQELLSGKFTISWHTIRKNLSVKSVDFMLLYRDSVTLKEFNQKIEEYKQPKNLLEKGESNENCSSPTNFQGSVNQNIWNRYWRSNGSCSRR